MEPTASSTQEVEEAIQRVSKNKTLWTKVTVEQRLKYLLDMRAILDVEYAAWANTSAKGHGYDPDNIEAQGHLLGETYVMGPAMMGNWLNAHIHAHEYLVANGVMPPPLGVRQCLAGPSGRQAVQVYPWGLKEKMAFDMRGELVIESANVGTSQTAPTQKPGGVVGILSAGNFDGPTDCLHSLFSLNHVVVCKPNPVNHHSSVHVSRVFKSLIDDGFIAFVHGGIEPGKILIESPLVDRLMLTGSATSYDRIVWGPPDQQAQRKKSNTPVCKKPVDSELGCVSPYIICPGVWSASELEAHAQQLVTAKMTNNGHICASPQIVITAKNWEQRDSFLKRVQELLRSHPGTRPYYPNSDQSYQGHCATLGEACIVKNASLFPGQQHPIFKTNYDPSLRTGTNPGYCTQTEAFCPVLVETAIDTGVECTPASFLPLAVQFANEKCWGNLSATLVVDTRSYHSNRDLVRNSVDLLNYGTVGVNQAAVFVPMFGQLLWGGYPGNTSQDIQSGIGKIGNAYGYTHPVKSIIWAPFTFLGQSTVPVPSKQAVMYRLLAEYLIVPTFGRLVRLAANLILGV